MIKQNPKAYFRHKITAYATLLGLRGIEPTQPVHIGVDGNVEYLRAASMAPGVDARGRLSYELSSRLFRWPIYRHAFWLAMLIACAAALLYVRLMREIKIIAILVVAAVILFFASYLPTMISSDFRYLFSVIPLITLVLLIIFLGSGVNYDSLNSSQEA